MSPAMDKLKAAGLIPLAFSGQKTWERNLFNAVMLGQGGPKLWQAVYGDKDPAAVKSAEFKSVAETYRQAARLCRRGRARPQLERRDQPRDPGQGRLPGHGRLGQGRVHRRRPDRRQGVWLHRSCRRHGGGYAMGGDVFAFPKTEGPDALKAQVACSPRCCSIPRRRSRSTQKKGSIPARHGRGCELARRLRAEGGEDGRRQDPAGAGAGAADAAGGDRRGGGRDLLVTGTTRARTPTRSRHKFARSAEADLIEVGQIAAPWRGRSRRRAGAGRLCR